MAYSGTTTFLMTRDDVIKAALRGLEVIGEGETPTSEDTTNCTQALNILLKAWATFGLVLFRTVDRTLSLTAGNAAYTLGPSGGTVTDLPLRIVDAYVTVAGADSRVVPINRYDYDQLSAKTTQGTPSQLFYDPQIPDGRIVLYPTPNASMTLHYVAQIAIQDAGSSTDNPNIPQEWYQLLKWGLMDEIGLEYGAAPRKLAYVAEKVKALKSEMIDFIRFAYSYLDKPGTADGKPREGRE